VAACGCGRKALGETKKKEFPDCRRDKKRKGQKKKPAGKRQLDRDAELVLVLIKEERTSAAVAALKKKKNRGDGVQLG